MYTTPYCAIIITRPFGDNGPEVHVHGDMWPVDVDAALDEVRRQIGTYEETPLDRFTAEHGLSVKTSTNRDGSYHAFMEASLREPGTNWGLLISSADGETPAAARRNLAARISGGTLVRGAMLPNPRYIQVPDLAWNQKTVSQDGAGQSQ